MAAVPAVVAVALALALVARAATWPVSATQFGAILGAILLYLVAAVFAFWAYACYTLHYVLDRRGLTIAWATLGHFIPMERIESVWAGRGEDELRLHGLSWPGLHVGRGRVGELGEALFYSTHSSAEDVVYVRTPAAIYALSPQDPPRFIEEVERFKQAAPRGGEESVRRDAIGGHPIWADRVAQWLALAAIVINVALWGYIFAIYPDLSPQITIEFPPVGDITDVHARSEILKIPAAALGLLGVNLIAALAFQWREQAGAYLVLTASVFLQLLFWVSAGIAVANA